jgi:hypothetical protein
MMEIKLSRSNLLKSKGQIILPSTPEVELSDDAKDSLNTILADIIKTQYKGDENDENT